MLIGTCVAACRGRCRTNSAMPSATATRTPTVNPFNPIASPTMSARNTPSTTATLRWIVVRTDARTETRTETTAANGARIGSGKSVTVRASHQASPAASPALATVAISEFVGRVHALDRTTRRHRRRSRLMADSDAVTSRLAPSPVEELRGGGGDRVGVVHPDRMATGHDLEFGSGDSGNECLRHLGAAEDVVGAPNEANRDVDPLQHVVGEQDGIAQPVPGMHDGRHGVDVVAHRRGVVDHRLEPGDTLGRNAARSQRLLQPDPREQRARRPIVHRYRGHGRTRWAARRRAA